MAASRRGHPPLHMRMPSQPSVVALPDLPPISALFLIDFDVKAGYTVSWKASKPGIELEGVVEYKSLPSGLHTVSEDLIYFVHDKYAGISAFVNAPVDDSAARNARMLAVGILVPLSYGRLGRAWKHAESLKAIASKLVVNVEQVGILEEYWDRNQARDSVPDGEVPEDTVESPEIPLPKKASQRRSRNRSSSNGTALMLPGHRLSPFHPAWSLTKLLNTFGPLIFPIHRAALLRKRILISGHAPVEEACNFVYDISILANIPLSTLDTLPPNSPPCRLRPLFSVGVHDIPFLTEDAKHATDANGNDQDLGTGWIACTTDSILSKKDTLWDVLITMPPPHASQAKKHIWPTVEISGHPVKATQRDMRRFRSLKAGLARLSLGSPFATPATPHPTMQNEEDNSLFDAAEPIVEPTSWTALAYSGFMWWASAGEKQRSDEAEEASHDAGLLADVATNGTMRMEMPGSAGMSTSFSSLTPRRSSTAVSAPLDVEEARTELAIIAYFHRLTEQILSALADVVDSLSESEEDDTPGEDQNEGDVLLGAEIEGERGIEGYGVRVEPDVVKRMGLDVWSKSDAEFVTALLKTYFDRSAYVEGKGVEICGMRVC
ncbi:hypothetical protein F5Y18DRAFT_380110 [Xylariaceae sp. FL1019]|nr:hypothetical protein F5Y18DRAFT_380110 [Xylariaceae sp. FL1019]